MKFNLQDKKIKTYLLKEAKSRVDSQKEIFREASIEKSGMAEFKGQRHLRNAINLRKWVSDPGPRIEQIKEEIEQNFSGFLRARLNIDGKNRLVSVKPGVNLPMEQTFEASIISPEQQAGLDPNGNLKQGQDPKGSPTGIPEKGMGSIYFRYSFTRTVLPLPETEEGEMARNMISEFQGLIESLGIKNPVSQQSFSLDGFISDLEQNRIALLPGFNKSGVPSYRAEEFMIQQSQTLSPADPGVRFIVEEVGKINTFNEKYNPSGNTSNHMPRYYSSNSRQVPVAHNIKLSDMDDTPISDAIRQEINESTLARLITFKIANGWVLDRAGLHKTVEKHLERIENGLRERQLPESQIATTMQFAQRKWNQQRDKMKRMARNIAHWVRFSEEKLQKTEAAYATEMAKPEELQDQDLIAEIKAYWGWQMKSRKENEIPNPSSMRVYTQEGPDDRIPFDWLHMQMILQNLTVRNDAFDIFKQGIEQYQIFDPTSPVQVCSDGMSQRIANVNKEDSIVPYMAPMTKKNQEIVFDHENVNLGLRQIRRNGEGISRLLAYGPAAKQIIDALISGNVDLSGVLSEELQQILTDYPQAFLGANVFYQWIKNISPEELAAQTRLTPGEDLEDSEGQNESNAGYRAGTPFDPNAVMTDGRTAYDYLKEYGYYLAKLMDMIYAISHSTDTNIISITKPNGDSRDVVLKGTGYSTSSGVGGGGEILLSIRYAYPCSLETFMPDEEQRRQYQRNLGKGIHEGRPGVGIDPLRQTQNVVTSPQRSMYEQERIMEPMPGNEPAQEEVKATILANLTYFLGQSSTLPSETGTYSMFHDTSTSQSWTEVQHKMQYLYRMGDLEDTTAQDTFISDCTNDLHKLEAAIQNSIKKVRDSLGQNLKVEVEDFEGEVTTIDGAKPPIETPAPPSVPFSGTGAETSTPLLPDQQRQQDLLDQTLEETEDQTQTSKPMMVQKEESGKKMFPKVNPEGKLQSASIQDKVIRLANIFDEKGFISIADKLDTLLHRLSE